MSSPWRAATAGLDLATAACAALNLGFFLHRLSVPPEATPSRRVAAFALALVSLGALVESLLVLSFTSAPPGSDLLSLPWTLARALPFAGTVCISALALRRIVSR